MIIAGVSLLLIIIVYIALSGSIAQKKEISNSITPTVSQGKIDTLLPTRSVKMNQEKAKLPAGVVAKVGKEYIYKDELELAVSNYGLLDGDKVKTEEFILNNMVNQSVALQAGEQLGLITLNSTIFNSASKDMEKRYQSYQEVRMKILDKSSSIQGAYVSLLFNNDGVGPLGLEASKQKAFEKIQPLQQQVASGQITLQQAGEQLKADTSNALLDPVFKLHAYREFKEEPGKDITIDNTFNTVLRKLNEGQTSDVHLLKVDDLTQNPPGIIETGYVFGQVTKKTLSTFNNFEEWVASQRKNYEIIY